METLGCHSLCEDWLSVTLIYTVVYHILHGYIFDLVKVVLAEEPVAIEFAATTN